MTFTIPAAVAWDPIGKQAVKNTSFQVYSTTDTGFVTPLAITDPFGAAIPGNILNSGTQGVFPQFNQAANSTVVIADPSRTYAWTVNAIMQDTSVAAYVAQTGSATALAVKAEVVSGATAAALSATFVPKWKATTAYLAGDKVLNPGGDVVSAIANFTSGASYDATNWNLSPTYAAFKHAKSPGYLLACFRAASGDLGGDQRLSVLWSQDGKTFADSSYAPVYTPTGPKVVRDPSIIFKGGAFYIAHTNTGATGASFDIIKSTDLINWTLVTTVDVSSIGSVTNTWAPELQVDSNGDVYAFFSINIQDPYYVKATAADLSTWAAPVALTVTGRPTQIIDPVFIKKGSLWYCFYKREDATAGNRLIYRATSATLTGTYATDKTGDWAGWGSNLEGPSIVQLHDGTYRMYLDEPNNTGNLNSYYYSDSSDLETWAAKVSVGKFPGDVPYKFRHGTVLTLTDDAAAIASGFGKVVSSARFNGPSNSQNQTSQPGVYLANGVNGANNYPGVYWSNGSKTMRWELEPSGDFQLDLPGVASSTLLKIISDRVEFNVGIKPGVYTTALRPSVWGTGQAGTVIYDSTLGKDIMWSGTGWVNPDGSNLTVSKAFVAAPLPVFQKALARAVAGEADARILCVGDSTTAGVGSGSTSAKQGTPQSFPYQMASLIGGAGYGVPASSGMGIPPSSLTGGTQDDRWTPGTGWALANYAWGGGACWFAQTGIVTPTVYNPAGYGADATTYDSFDIYYITNSSGPGTFNAQATGGSVVPVNATTGSGDTAKVTITAGSAASTNTVTITPVSGQVYIVGIEPFNSAVRRVRVANAGVASSRTSHWVASNPGFGAIPAIKRYAPDLTIISLGINDALASIATATYDSQLAQIITAAAVSGDVLLVSPVPSKSTAGTVTIKLERAYAGIMLGQGKAFTDLRDAIATPGNSPVSLMFDDLHPNATGYARIASQLLTGIVRV